MPEERYHPLIIAFCCQWCAYPGADLAGIERLEYSPGIRIIRVRCSGMVHPALIVGALTSGADGVMVLGCHPGECHFGTGNLQAEKVADAVRIALNDLDIEEQRFRLAWVSASEGHKFADLVSNMSVELSLLGPSQYRNG